MLPHAGVLGHADVGGEGAHFEGVPGPVGVGPDRADHRGRDEGEDPHPVGRLRRGGRQDERGLGQVRPARQALHLLVGHVRAVEDDGNRVAETGHRGKHVDLHKRT
jgi:hypothetical protein